MRERGKCRERKEGRMVEGIEKEKREEGLGKDREKKRKGGNRRKE